jgi:MFS family permease
LSAATIGRLREQGRKVFYGWWIVAAGFLINAFGVGTFFYGFSTFFNPLMAEFGWSRTLLSGVFSLSRLEGGIEGPIAGWLTDRFGARKILLVGVAVTGAGFILLRMVDSPVSLYVIFGFVALGFNIGYVHATSAAVAKWFIRRRSRALSLLMTGNGVGGAVFVPAIAWLIVQYDWRVAAIAIGVATLAIPLPVSLLVRSTPEEMGLRPDGEPTGRVISGSDPDRGLKATPADDADTEDVSFGVREAMRTRAFWTYVFSMTLRACILSAIVVHQIPHLTDIGIPYQTASDVLGLMVLASVPGRFVFGWLGDRFDKKRLLFLLCLLQGLGVFIFINATTLPLLYLFVVVYGLGYGGVIPLSISLRADLFGRQNYATIAGIAMSFSVVGNVAAPLLAGYLYDTTQSYSLAFYVFLVMIVLAGVSFLMIPQPTRRRA